MKLSKEQHILLSNIFHHRYDGWVATDKGRQEEPVVTFSTCEAVVEEFLSRIEPAAPAQIDWIPGPPDQSGDYLISSKHWPHPSWEAYEPDSVRWDSDEVLFHVGPIPKTPDRV
jgi:hypothetical protein